MFEGEGIRRDRQEGKDSAIYLYVFYAILAMPLGLIRVSVVVSSRTLCL